jgi:hypothetical protein
LAASEPKKPGEDRRKHRDSQVPANADTKSTERRWAGKTINDRGTGLKRTPAKRGTCSPESLIIFPAAEIGAELTALAQGPAATAIGVVAAASARVAGRRGGTVAAEVRGRRDRLRYDRSTLGPDPG